ncbi:larval cuticle protein 2-like [Eriocheir sinensis]|uniref:larval cuticle protein 2-like n=1 Tax=Eriocheir sinensis TaxID=95602 RepID=UPI0021C9FF45|nr:larval cuticle protein 2-like [Eriocheir sinensis]
MKFAVVTLLALAAVVAARPDKVMDIDLEDIHHDLDIADDTSVTGTYSWTSPEGESYFVKYVADEDGYRVVESNVVPASVDGVRADGAQGSFVSVEDVDDDDLDK